MSNSRHLRPAPPITGGVVLQPKRPAAEGAPRPFRITIEGAIAPDGTPLVARLNVESEPGRPVTPLEAEAICRRLAFAPPAAAIGAPPRETETEDGGGARP